MKIKDSDIMAALRANGGLQAQAAQSLGIDRSSLAKRIKRKPALMAVREENLQTFSDGMEGAFLAVCKAVIAKPSRDDLDVMKYYLETHARDRGYGQRLKLGGPNDEPIQPFDPIAYATFIAGLTDEERAALATLQGQRPTGLAAAGEPAGEPGEGAGDPAEGP